MLSESEVEPPVEAKAKLARLMGGGAKEKMQPKVAGAWGRVLGQHGFLRTHFLYLPRAFECQCHPLLQHKTEESRGEMGSKGQQLKTCPRLHIITMRLK